MDAEDVQAAYVQGELSRRDAVTFAYMWSANQHLGDPVGAWRPHMMASSLAWENDRARFNRIFDVEAEGYCGGAYRPLPIRS